MKCKKKFWETMLSMLVKIKHFEVYRKEKVDPKKKVNALIECIKWNSPYKYST